MKKFLKKFASAFIALAICIPAVIFGTGAQTTTGTVFDDSNVVLKFGVLSDIHISGSWNIATSKNKLDRACKSLLALAGKDAGGNTLLDAVLINGDITDAMSSSGNVETAEKKLYQNYLELSGFRDVTLSNFNSMNKSENVAIIYANGNHDSSNGMSADETGYIDTTKFYSPKLFQKVLSGYEWVSEIPETSSASEQEVIEYNKQLIKSFNEKNGKNYDFFYGGDLNLGENGLDYGNRHVVVGGYHFLTVEPVEYTMGETGADFSEATIKWLDDTLAEITAKEPDKAVFVASHARIRNTIFSSVSNATTELTPVLDKYPQVIIWGGHEHSALNRELAIWQENFTAVDSGVVQYANAGHFGFEDGYTPINANGLGGWSGKEFRSFSQGHFVEVDLHGNVRISRVDFYNSDVEEGNIKIIGKPWVIPAPKADKSHLEVYPVSTRSAKNTAPYFDKGAKLSVSNVADENKAEFSFPAAKDDTRVISYFLTVKKEAGATLSSTELTSFYYEYADASLLESKTYSFTLNDLPANEKLVATVYGIDDFGAKTDELSAEFMVKGVVKTAYPAREFNLSKLNQNGWSADINAGVYTQNVDFEGRKASVITKKPENLSSSSHIIMNNWSTPFKEVDKYPYLVVDYYYQHDDSSSYAAAQNMRWRFFVWELGYRQIDTPADIFTNRWATAVFPLEPYFQYISKDGYKLNQYKFDPLGETAIRDLDNNDKVYISGIRLVHELPEVFTENGKTYLDASGYIEGVAAPVYSTATDAVNSLGSGGGIVYVNGEISSQEKTILENATKDGKISIKYYGVEDEVTEPSDFSLFVTDVDDKNVSATITFEGGADMKNCNVSLEYKNGTKNTQIYSKVHSSIDGTLYFSVPFEVSKLSGYGKEGITFIVSVSGNESTKTASFIFAAAGDMDENGKINTDDLVYMRKALAGLTDASTFRFKDADGNGSFSTDDLLAVRKKVAGLS